MKVDVKTFFTQYHSQEEIDGETKSFENWEPLKHYLISRLKIMSPRQFLKITINSRNYVETGKEIHANFDKIKDEFNLSVNQNIYPSNQTEKTNKKEGRIEIRIDESEKERVLKKCKKLGLNVSEYTRQLYLHGEIVIVDEQTKRDVRGMAINLNQIAKRINAGATSPGSAISELQNILSEIKKTYNR